MGANKKNISNIVYQYCSFKTFTSMLENKEIWLSDINKMNDYEESKTLTITLRLLLNFLDKNHNNNILSKPKKIKDLENFIKESKLSSSLEKDLLTTINDQYINDYQKKRINVLGRLLSSKYLIKDSHDNFITCFSSFGDILSQWRAYADDGAGFSIGFKRAELERLLNKLNNSEVKFIMNNVVYLNNNTITTQKEFNDKYTEICKMPNIDFFEDFLKDEILNEKITIENDKFIHTDRFLEVIFPFFYKQLDELYNTVAFENKKDLQTTLSIQSNFYKNYYFNEEKEYRILLIDFNSNKSHSFSETKEYSVKLSSPHYRERNNSLVKYRKIIFHPNLFKNLISSIYIGSKNKVSVKEVIELLKHHDLYNDSINIQVSKASYR